jgi:hypothetical protein
LIEAYTQRLLDAVANLPIASTFNITLDKRTSHVGLIRGDVYFTNDSHLHFRELIEVRGTIVRKMYSYHYQDAKQALIFRYDDTPHHPGLDYFPYHKHDGSEANVIAAPPPDLDKVLTEIEALYPLA